MKRSSAKGFTLIELLVVIAIIGLLSTLAVVALNSARQRSRDAKRVSDIRQIQTALELAFSETNNYPAESAVTLGLATDDVLCNNSNAATFQGDTTGCSTIYMGLVPTNP
ncbi:MAG TPA: type II secretion system protein, partial [Candidatus Baltobacteraceae bacterium]|nr:type II secretion system protein [Candidatus Baltobacteraceae bacterium]